MGQSENNTWFDLFIWITITILMGANLMIQHEPFKKIFMKYLLVVATMLGLVGCATVHFSPAPPLPEPIKATAPALVPTLDRQNPIQVLTEAELAATKAPATPIASSMSLYRYGRFEVEVVGDKQTVIGGEFVPSALPEGFISSARHLVRIDYTTKELSYYRKLASGLYEPMIGFAVVTPLPSTLPSATVIGTVTKIVEKPTWCPKVGGTVRRDDPSLPKGCLPYGHLQNAMGDWRFDIAWPVKGWELIKVHGTTGYPRGSFWLEDTHGCTRLENRAIKRLVEILGPSAVKEGIEIVLEKGNPLLLHAL
jgi:hypothetical protein